MTAKGFDERVLCPLYVSAGSWYTIPSKQRSRIREALGFDPMHNPETRIGEIQDTLIVTGEYRLMRSFMRAMQEGHDYFGALEAAPETPMGPMTFLDGTPATGPFPE